MVGAEIPRRVHLVDILGIFQTILDVLVRVGHDLMAFQLHYGFQVDLFGALYFGFCSEGFKQGVFIMLRNSVLIVLLEQPGELDELDRDSICGVLIIRMLLQGLLN